MQALVPVILLISIAAQITAAVIAIQQLKSAGRYRFAWISISVALLLMVERRVAPLFSSLSGAQVNFFNEIFGLLISLLMLFGLLGLRRLFVQMHRQEAELERQAHEDFLTGLSSRRHFMEQGEVNLARALRYGSPLTIFMMDIDHFKSVNDTYGHKAGDVVLQKLGQQCKTILREVDVIGRIGGEEFAIILPETGHEKGLEVAERLRKSIAEMDPTSRDIGPEHITVSIGVTSIKDGDSRFDHLLGRADSALYQAKEKGRNKVCAAP